METIQRWGDTIIPYFRNKEARQAAEVVSGATVG
jgi:hypothetical protein